jgi:hypothetical protein
MVLGNLFETVYVHVKFFESDHARLDVVYPGIRALCQNFEAAATKLPNPIANAYQECSLNMKRYCLETTHFICQLSSVLTVEGRHKARNGLCSWVTDPPNADDGKEETSDSSSTSSDVDGCELEWQIEPQGQSEEDVLENEEEIDDDS